MEQMPHKAGIKKEAELTIATKPVRKLLLLSYAIPDWQEILKKSFHR
jgi:hypothetical protein